MAKLPTISIVLIRCGQTEWDQTGRLVGAADLPLSESGREAVSAALGAQADAGALSVVHCGSDEASRQTADLTAGVIGGKCRSSSDLSEMHLGLWEGLTREKVAERWPTAYSQWEEEPGSVRPPEGESADEAQDRVVSAMSRLACKARGEGGVGFVLHPIALSLVRSWLERRPIPELWSVEASDEAIVRVEVERDRLTEARNGIGVRPR